jgi:hypothetical protein
MAQVIHLMCFRSGWKRQFRSQLDTLIEFMQTNDIINSLLA